MKLSGVTSVLVVGEDKDVLTQVGRVLKSLGVADIVISHTAEQAATAINLQAFQLVMIDQKMHRRAGLNLIQELRSGDQPHRMNLPILVLTGTMSRFDVKLLHDLDYLQFISMPFSDMLIAAKIFEILASGDISSAHSRIDTIDNDQFIRVVCYAIQNGQLDSASEFIDRRIAEAEKSPRLHNLLASLRFAEGKLDEAFTIVEKILQANPDFLPTLNLKAKISTKLGLIDEALKVMEYAHRLSPLNTQRLMAMGEIHLGYSRLQAAKDKFRRALELCPQLERAKIGLARVFSELEQHQEAQDLMKTLDDPMMVTSELNLKAVLLAKGGRPRDAIALYGKALGCCANARYLAMIYYNIALAYVRLGDYKQAESFVDKSMSLERRFDKSRRLKKKLLLGLFTSETEVSLIEESSLFSAEDDEVSNQECVLTQNQINFLMGTTHPLYTQTSVNGKPADPNAPENVDNRLQYFKDEDDEIRIA